MNFKNFVQLSYLYIKFFLPPNHFRNVQDWLNYSRVLQKFNLVIVFKLCFFFFYEVENLIEITIIHCL